MALFDKLKGRRKDNEEAEKKIDIAMEKVDKIEDELEISEAGIGEEVSNGNKEVSSNGSKKNSFLDRFRKKEQDVPGDAMNGEGLITPEEAPEETKVEAPEKPKEEALNEIKAEEPAEQDDKAAKKKSRFGFLDKFKQGLSKTRHNINEQIEVLVKSSKKLDEDFWEELEEILIQADVGVNTSVELVKNIRQTAKKKKINDSSEVLGLIREEVSRLLKGNGEPLNIRPGQTSVILVVGVNGAGKTTSIGKLAYRFKQEGNKVLLAAADTFRAAAIDQLQVWADRVGVELIKHHEGSDPGAVVFDALSAARARQADILIIDTAGRLQNKSNLMKEIAKVKNIIEREIADGPHEVLLVLDATTGQNAISQARIFEEATGVTGLVLTKLDGTAKGGIVLAVSKELDIPVKLVGIGEELEDLRDFSPDIFAQALFED